MVRPKKTPASTLAISRKSSLASKSKQSKSNDIESDNESPATNNKRKLTKRLTSAGKLSTNQDEQVNDESSVSENGNDLKNNSKKKQQQQQLKEEPSDLKDDSKSIDCESAVKDKQTRTKKIANKSEKTATPDEIASQTDKEPRKRRIASLNAEFLVHYCSSSNNNNNHSNINGTNLENKKLNNCPDTVSIASSLKQELNTTTNNSNNKTNKNNKRQRILSVDSEKMKKEEASELEETNPNLKIKNNGTDKKSKKKSNNDELDESNTEKKNENFRKKNPTDEVDEEEEEEDVEEDEVEKEVAQNKTTKRKPVHTRNSASRYSKGSDNVICKKTPNKKSIKFESDVEEEEHESDQEDEEKSNNLKKVALKGRKAKRKLKKPLKKQPESESDHTDTESSVHSKKRRNTGAKRKAVDKSVVLESPQPTVRPKREAGMRASAMIIQTNEIEKTRFQYYSSNSTPNHSNAPGQPAPVLNVSASSKKKSNLANETNRKKAKNAEQPISKTDFQVPQSMSLFASLTAAAAVAATSKTSKTLAKSRSTNLTASSPFTSSQMNQQIATSTSRQISNTTHLNNLAGDDSSSNDVLIVMETTSATKKASQTNKTPVERTLTEDLLAEHNKLNGTLGCGSGTFSNYTREFISKWALEYKCNDEKPFPPGFIPIESFGVKILNEPQYLQNKSRFGGSSSSSSTANQVPIAPVPVATMTAPKLNQRNTNMANNSSTSPAKTTQPIIEIENKAVNEQVLSNHSTKPNNVQPPQVSQKTFSSNSNNRNSQSQPNLTSNFPASQIISSNINDILVNTASSISLNKAIASNPTFNNLAAALNLNLSLQQQQQQQQQPQQQPKQNQSGLPLKKSFHSPLVAAVAVAQSLQSFQNSKKANNSTSLQAPMSTSVPTATTNSNFTFLNSFNATQLSQQIPSEWQFNQAFKTRDSLNASTSIENLLANGAIAGSKSYEIWNKIKSNHECNGNLSTSHEDSLKAISLIDEAAASFKNGSALFSSELSQAFSKLKSQQIKDQTQQQDSSVSAPNMTMINVENLNFYTSIEGEPPRFSNHELGCSGCLRNTNSCNQFNNNYHINQQQVEIPTTTPLESHMNCPQTTAAAVAMNIAKLLTNNSKNLVQTNNDNNSQSVFVSNFQNKTPIASSDKKQPQRLTKSTGNSPNLEIKKPSSTTLINESLKDENFSIKTENCKTKSFEKDEEKNKNGTQKDSCNQLSCSCRIKLEPECMTITIDTNNDHKNCCEAFQEMDLKLSPSKVNILKKKSNNQENCDSDSESVRSCSSSSSGSLVRLVVDEASSILEPSDSNLSKAKKIDTTEIVLAKTESIDKDNMSDSNFVTDVSKDNNSSSTRFFFSNKNSSEETALDKNTSEDSKNLTKKPKRWTFCQSELNDVETRDEILKDISNNIQISTNDFIVFNSDCLKNQSSKETTGSKPEAISGVYHDLINESSNTNYSAEDEDEEDNKNESKSNSLCFGQVCSLWNDTESDMAMIKVKLFLRPEQIRNDLETSDAEKEKVFEENELILSNFYLNEYEAENIRQKCLIFDRNSYENWKSEKLRKNDLKDDRSIVTEKAEALNAFFYRYEYDFNKKSFVMN